MLVLFERRVGLGPKKNSLIIFFGDGQVKLKTFKNKNGNT